MDTPATEGAPVSEATLSEPLPDRMTDAVPPTSARWGFWGTCAWGIGAFAVFYASQLAVMIGLFIWWLPDPAATPAEIRALASHAVVVSTTTIVCVPMVVLFLALAVRLARVPFVDYLALKPVGTRTMLFVLVCTLALGVVFEVLSMLAGRPLLVPFVAELYRTARTSGTLPLVLIAVVVAAPITEELLFRSFLMRGWAASW